MTSVVRDDPLAVPSHPLAEGFASPWAAEWGEDRFGPFEVLRLGKVKYRMRWIPPGTFLMGSPESEAGRWDDEGPQHKVRITQGLWLGETPCTQALWTEVMGANPSGFQGVERPVERVSWEDCREFFAKLERKAEGFGGRFPSEAEWEYACRGGEPAATWVGELSLDKDGRLAKELDAIAWYVGNSKGETHPVGLKQANPFGLHDMLGNVLEWCADWSARYEARDAVDPRGPDVGRYRVYRGGSWLDHARYCRAALRAHAPVNRYHCLGFRLARGPSLDPGAEPAPRSGSPRGGAPSSGERSRPT
jgi:sulfatase modifying factor 1